MNRKIIGICTALVALAAVAAAPALSSGAVLQDTVNGVLTPIEVGKKIVAYNEVNEPTILNASGLKVECQEAIITGSVHANSGGAAGTIFGTIEDVWFRGTEPETRCSSSLGAATVTIPRLTNEPKTGGGNGEGHWCIKSLPEDEFQVEPRNCTETTGGEFTFVIHAGGMTCRYKREANIKGKIVNTGDVNNVPVTLKMNDGQEFTREAVSSFVCPMTGKLEQFHFQMYTDTGPTGPNWRPEGDLKDPIFISEK
jgi:hypothetical protein